MEKRGAGIDRRTFGDLPDGRSARLYKANRDGRAATSSSASSRPLNTRRPLVLSVRCHPEFPSTVMRPGRIYREAIGYRFTTDGSGC